MGGLLDEAMLLRLATAGRLSHPRRALMLAAAGGIAAAEALPLGARDAALMRLRRAWFGDACPCLDACPACTRTVEFDVPLAALTDMAEPAPEAPEWRRLTTADLLKLESLPAPTARRALAEAVTGGPVDEAGVPEVEAWLTRADPLSHVVLDLTCAYCGAAWARPFDIVRQAWDEVALAGRRLLDEIHLLARTYHWSEAEILAVPRPRRRAYLEMIAT